ncbi:MAG: ABC transporter permease subunit [Cellulomonas sp.]|uniref:ABC transporter permease n=1 Tax=Cellulomonas sp. 73-92 TaxID=1895740 RepID=UPI00092BA7A1|nr:ABC transporter permease subunit [Cellulomonas sp. 73-92]MBN9374011.1 ABC transporter permease subunit [Cellulomonas sp.]OJV75967.1 MAG: sulfonate ABC transporter permease [Cellulomonas sp. 73-92]
MPLTDRRARIERVAGSVPARVRWVLGGFGWADLVVAAGVLVVFYVAIRTGAGVNVRFNPSRPLNIDTDPARLPYYAARSLLRMFVALAASIVFTFVYGYAAARSRRLEKVLIPALDILQSVPILGFLTIAVTTLVRLFPHSLLGLELASVFAIFTSQAWNMTFSFYNSLISLPRELDELSRNLRLTRWMRFWKIEVPSATIGLVWNGMLSFGGGWFFLVASEAITVANHDYTLPGVGAFAGAAIAEGNLAGVGYAIVTMAILVVGVNFLFWRPLTAWAEKFKQEQSEAVDVPRSLVLDLLRRSHWSRLFAPAGHAAGELLDRAGRVFGTDTRPLTGSRARRRVGDVVFTLVVVGLIAWGLVGLLRFLTGTGQGLAVFVEPLLLGLATLARVVVVIVAATLVWVPIGVWIGTSPRLARIAQPVVQVLSSFPANFLFPLVTWVLVRTGLSLNIGGAFLMSLGAQWYILFNAIAGAQAIPTDLREATNDLGVRGWQRWRRLILPAIFPYYVTGAITASGGAWNASIVAEIVTFGATTLTASGLGSYIADATATGDYPRILAGIAVMSLYVVGLNRLFWSRLSTLAETRYSLT